MTAETIIESSISMVCLEDHPLAARPTIRLPDLARHKLVTLARAHSTRAMIDRAFDQASVAPRSYIEAGNCQAVCEFVEAGLGIGLVHTFCTRRAASPKLRYRDLSRYLGTGAFSAIYQKQTGPHPALFKKLKEALFAPV
jgi:DNA-binding transcriptional LysR family regulator